MKFHIGYFSCFHCTLSKASANRRLVFPSNKGVARNSNFRSRKQKGRHNSSSLFEVLQIGIIIISVGLYARNLSGAHEISNKYIRHGWSERTSAHRINPSADRSRQAFGHVSVRPVWVLTKVPAVIFHT